MRYQTPTPYRHWLRDIDRWIKRGEGERAKKRLLTLSRRDWPASERLVLARLARKVKAPALGIRILRPLIRSPYRKLVQVSEEAKREYASCLSGVGAGQEALELLASLHAHSSIGRLLEEAWDLMSLWDYARASERLAQCLREGARLGRYERLMIRINLAACWVHERKRAARPLLRVLLHETSLWGGSFLQGHCWQLAAELLIQEKKWDEAERALDAAEKSLKEAGSREFFFIEKWRAVLSLYRGDLDAVDKVNHISQQALERGHWEARRDLERHLAVAHRDQERFLRLYFGIPFDGFRRALLRDFDWVQLPNFYVWQLGESTGGPLFDLFQEKTETASLRPGSTLHRLVLALASDFYRPFRIVSLFRSLFPGECYNPDTSPPRVHQAVKLFRQWAIHSHLPLEIEAKDGFYRLRAARPCRVRVRREQRAEKFLVYLSRLRSSWPHREFSVKEASRILGISERSTQRVTEEAIRKGYLVRLGNRSRARYLFCDPGCIAPGQGNALNFGQP